METPERKKYRFRIENFGYALRGIFIFFRHEFHALLHLIALLLVVFAGFWFKISPNEWIAITVVSSMVIISEMFNTSIEKLCDLITKSHHPEIGKIKDITSGAVLVSAIAAVITGVIVFLPKIIG